VFPFSTFVQSLPTPWIELELEQVASGVAEIEKGLVSLSSYRDPAKLNGVEEEDNIALGAAS
jgi:hypothetical protein